MSFEKFIGHIKKGLPLPVYLLYSSEHFFHKEVIELIKGLVPEEERDFNLHIFDYIYDLTISKSEHINLENILNVVNTISFFRSKRFTILSGNLNMISSNDLKKLSEYISNPASKSVFVLIHYGTFSKELKERFKFLQPISLDISERELPYWVKHRITLKGMEISDEAVEYLIGIVGADIGLLTAEIEKISLLGLKRIGIKDISDIIEDSRLFSTFDLSNALINKDSERVFKIYKTLQYSSDDYSLIGTLNWLYGRVMSGRSKQKDNHTLKAFEILHNADKDMKSSGRSYPMEYLLVKLLRI